MRKRAKNLLPRFSTDKHFQFFFNNAAIFFDSTVWFTFRFRLRNRFPVPAARTSSRTTAGGIIVVVVVAGFENTFVDTFHSGKTKDSFFVHDRRHRHLLIRKQNISPIFVEKTASVFLVPIDLPTSHCLCHR